MGSTVFHMGHTEPLTAGVVAAVADAISASGIPKSAVAQRAGMARTTLHRRLRGDSDFTVSELFRVALVLHVQPADLIPRGDAA